MSQNQSNPMQPTAEWVLPLSISISVGTPVLGEVTSLAQTSAAMTSQTRLTTEGQFSSSPPAATTAPFNLSALSAQTFTWKAALSLALASKLAYETEESIKKTCLSGESTSWGFSTCDFVDFDDTQCFVATTADLALVSFRGTESRGDWFRNVNVPGRTRDYGVAHRGFLGAFQAVESQLRSSLAGMAGRKLIVTGHSLGGALATVMAAEWQSFMPAAFVATFGQPAVGRGAFRMFFLQNYSRRFFRFVNDSDIVAQVPPGYEHVGRLLHFDAQGNLQNGQTLLSTERASVESLQMESIDPGPPMLTEAEYQRLQSRIGQEVLRVNQPLTESTSGTQLEGIFTTVSDHSLDTYIAKIAPKARS
jgi:hypothetical protein